VGMGKIIWGRYALSAIVGIIMAMGFMLLLRVLAAFYSRKLVEKRSGFYGMQWVQALVALAIIVFLLWCAMQKYLFLTSVFPILSLYLGAALFIFAVMLFCDSLSR
jgi:energy-coupling factor transporter transmembrane protein EcfT